MEGCVVNLKEVSVSLDNLTAGAPAVTTLSKEDWLFQMPTPIQPKYQFLFYFALRATINKNPVQSAHYPHEFKPSKPVILSDRCLNLTMTC